MKKIILFLLLLYNVATVAQKSDATMIATATGIKNATAAGSLTPTIIGNMFLDIVKNKSNKIYAGNATGTNDYVLNVSDGVTSYVYGQWFLIGFGNSSTGAVTFNYNGAGALAVKNDAGTQLNTGDLTSGVVKLIVYNGSYFQVVGGSGSGGGGGPTSGSGITVAGTAVNFGGTQTSDAIINGDGGTYGTTFDEQGHFIVNVQGGSDFSVSVADAGDINLSPNSGNINLTTFGSNLTQIVASGSGFAFSVSGAGIQLNVNSDGTGDTHYRNSSGYLARRAIGSTGDVYTVSGGLPIWTAPSVAVSGITGLGTGVATALGINIGSAGSFITNGGALGTPSSGVATNLTGTASGLTAGTVTTNANLGGDIVSSGNTTTYSGVVPTNKGGSGQITANAALNAFLPSQASANGKVLQSDGTNSSWVTPSSGFTNPMTSVGDLIQGSTAGAAVRLASVATGNALISGGLTTLSSWGKITSGHIDGTIQPTASPTFTGTITFPSPWTLGSTSVTSTGTELNYVAGVTSAIQTQLNGKQATITFGTGVQTALGVNVGSAGAPVLFNGAGGAPSSIGLANGTGLPESGVTNLTTDLSLKGNKAMTPNIQTSNYTLVLTDADVKQVIANSASNINFTVPPNSSVAYPVGALVTLGTINTGGFTLVPGAGVTLTPPTGGNLLDAGQGQPVQIYQRAIDAWDVWNGSTPITPGALTKTDDTNVTMTLGGSPTTALLQASSMTLGWTGTLSTARGGTGGTAGAWPLTGTGTLTGATTMAGTSTNIIKYSFPSLGTTITDGAGLWFQNSTAAAAGTQQRSPGIVWEGQGWKTTATAGTQTVKWRADLLPVQGTTSPTGNLVFTSEVNGSATGGLLTLASDGAKLTTSANGLKILTNASTFGGISLDANAPSANTINVGNNGFTITNTANVNNPADAFQLNSAAATNTTGTVNGLRLNIPFAPTSGTGVMNLISTTNAMAVNQTGGSSGIFKVMDFNHTYTATGGDVTFIDYRPTVTSITGNHYGIRIQSIANSAFSTTSAPTAKIFIGAGTATANTAPLKFTSGTDLTVKENGAVQYDGNVIKYTANSVTYNTGNISGNYSGSGTATTTFTVTIGQTQPNTTYKVFPVPTNTLSAVMFFVTNKTTTTFDVTFATGLTGTVAFDWFLVP